MRTRKIFFSKLLFVFLTVFLIGLYFVRQTKTYFRGPEIFINSPKSGEVFTDSFIAVKGRVSNVRELFINGKRVLADNEGNFESSLILAGGYNIIGIRAVDKFGRKANKKLELVLK